MGYCLNPKCPHPENLISVEQCEACGSQLVLRDRYRIIKALAQGGFGATFLAQDEGSPGTRKCVVKQLRLSTSAPEVFHMARQLFAREAKTLAKIGVHPQVPRLLDYFEDNQQFYLVQEYISGLTLQQEVRSGGPFSEAGVRQFLSEFLPLLQDMHDQKVIHRDIKPANLIRRAEDRKLVLIDFGAVKDQVTQTTNNKTDTHTAFTAFAVGTRGFAPPEQIALRPVYASDVYALGVTCLYLLIGKSPQELDYNSTTGEILWQDKVEVSHYLKKVLGKMLEWSVRHRYQSANEVLKALQLEPYMDSLAKGMSAQASNGSNSPLGDDSHATSINQIAAGIRARRAKSGEALDQTVNLRSQLLTPAATLKTPGSTRKKPKITRKLDTNGLIKAYIDGRRSFPLHDLSLLDLQRANLATANFYSSKLDRTNFYKANLYKSDFSEASLKHANLKEANLSKADFSHADLEEADLRGADLSYAEFNDANLRGANLCGANLINAKISEEQLASAKINIMTVRPSGKRGLF